MCQYKRTVLIILDSVGCGAQDDCKKYQKCMSNTLLSVYNNNHNFKLPNLEMLGLKKILFNKHTNNNYCSGKIRVRTAGNDTLASIWEMFGVIFKKRFRSIKKGFDKKLLAKIEAALGTPVLCNRYMASRDVFNYYYKTHKKTGYPILYFADDGVVLLSGHKNVISPRNLKSFGKKLAKILKNEKENVVRIITRSFVGNQNYFMSSRKDSYFPIIKEGLPSLPIIDNLHLKGIKITSTEHIASTLAYPNNLKTVKGDQNNIEMVRIIVDALDEKSRKHLLIFCLQDFDKFGHKKDPLGYGLQLKAFDGCVPIILDKLKKDDLLIITADHGCDPTIPIRGHTREFVPLMIYSKQIKSKIWLGTRNTLADIGQTICKNYNLPPLSEGKTIEEIF